MERKDGGIPASTFKHNSGSQTHKKPLLPSQEVEALLGPATPKWQQETPHSPVVENLPCVSCLLNDNPPAWRTAPHARKWSSSVQGTKTKRRSSLLHALWCPLTLYSPLLSLPSTILRKLPGDQFGWNQIHKLKVKSDKGLGKYTSLKVGFSI